MQGGERDQTEAHRGARGQVAQLAQVLRPIGAKGVRDLAGRAGIRRPQIDADADIFGQEGRLLTRMRGDDLAGEARPAGLEQP